jgi:nicotinate phosphoribosyltransferase
MPTSESFESNTRKVLAHEFLDPNATIELMPQGDGVFCGVRDVLELLHGLGGHGFQVWSLDDGETLKAGEVAMRMRGHFLEYVTQVNGIAGILATLSGWATAARAIVTQATPLPVVLTASHLVLPEAVAKFEYAAQVGGCLASDSPLGVGVSSRALILLLGDTLRAVRVADQTLPQDVPRLAFVDTYHEAVDEAVRVALGLGDHLTGVIVEAEMSGSEISIEVLNQIRAQLDLAGFPRVKIFVYGNVTAQNIAHWKSEHAPLDGFFVGDTIAAAAPIPFAAELKESDGKPLARRGLVPGTTPNPRLKRIDVE